MELLSSRAIQGMFVSALEADTGAAWMNMLSMLFNSDQDGETYAWLGQTPAMREWVGGRNAKGFRDNSIEIKNLHFESTVKILLKHLRRDKTGQAQMRINELAGRAQSHWAKLISDLILNGPSTVCYDGQFFFDTDHSEGDSGTQSNDISVDISALPVGTNGVVTAPSVEEMQQSILKGIAQVQSFKDDQGEPINETAENFIVMVPTSLTYVAQTAISMPRSTGLTEQSAVNMSIGVVQNPRLNSWTDKFAVFRTDGATKPFIRQQETIPMIKRKGVGSDYEFDNDAHEIGIDAWRNVGYGHWQHACLVTMV